MYVSGKGVGCEEADDAEAVGVTCAQYAPGSSPISVLRERLAANARVASLPPDAHLQAGLELRRPDEGYCWDGLKRGGDPKRPSLLLQITLTGTGCWVGPDGSAVALPEGRGFFAVLPSTHRYLLPATATEEWGFFWLIIRHPYVITRLAARLAETGAVWDFGHDALAGAVRGAAARLALIGETAHDRFDEEAALFDLLLCVERAARARRHGGAETAAARERLLEETRGYVENRLASPIGVPDLARARGMERSRYSHHFRAVTGTTPGRFMTQVRLESASRRLAETDATLDVIAAETGFADANHLCKVFRRHYHVSPGAYRKQIR